MSKVTIPLLMIFAAIGFFALAKLDRDGERKKTQKWPAVLAPVEEEEEEEDADRAPDLIALPESLTGEQFERHTDREIDNIRLLELSEAASPVSFLWPTREDEDSPAEPELLELAQRDAFDHWKSFSDEHIAFFYPDSPGVRVEPLAPTEPVPLLAPLMMLPPDPGAFRKYRITAGDRGTLCVISLARADSFDDAPRAPQPEVFHRYTESGGGLMRTSFTARGQVRRVEVLGKNTRASLLDWPHLAVHQEIYLRMGASIELPNPRAKFPDLRKAAIAKYGLEGKLGFLDQGAPESEVIAALGRPAAIDAEGGSLAYYRRDGAEHIVYKVPIRAGLFVGFGEDWRESSHPEPAGGSIRWMFEKTSPPTGRPGVAGYDIGAMTDHDAQAIFDRFVELAPGAKPDDWAQLCQVVANLAHHDLRDQRVVEIARARLQKAGADPRPALLALESCDSELAKGAITEHIIGQFASASLETETLEHIDTLIAYLGRDFPGSAQLIDRAICHQSGPVRELGFKYCDWLPEKYALPHLETGLTDASIEVRRLCASAFASAHGDPAKHAEMLAIRLSQEADEEVKISLEAAIQRLGGDDTGS